MTSSRSVMVYRLMAMWAPITVLTKGAEIRALAARSTLEKVALGLLMLGEALFRIMKGTFSY